MSTYLSVDAERCRREGHQLRTVWSDKTPLKVSLICVTCSTSGQTAYAAYGDATKSWGLWKDRSLGPKEGETQS